MSRPTGLRHSIAISADIPAIAELMSRSIAELQRGFLSDDQIAASRAHMGLDTQLIVDRTYFLIHRGDALAGCGGWSMRATLFGGDASGGRDPARLDPASQPARIRAMYTHPDHVRRGVGRYLLDLCERSAAAAGFRSLEMAATLAGVPLYEACGYAGIEPFEARGADGIAVPLIRMGKAIAP
jgi:GNAT superfamily N-acetyltransferase